MTYTPVGNKPSSCFKGSRQILLNFVCVCGVDEKECFCSCIYFRYNGLFQFLLEEMHAQWIQVLYPLGCNTNYLSIKISFKGIVQPKNKM